MSPKQSRYAPQRFDEAAVVGGVVITQRVHPRVDQALLVGHLRDDLVEQHGGARLVERGDLPDGAGVAFGAVENPVHLGAGRRGAGQPRQRGRDHRTQRQAEFAAQRRDHAAHPRRHRRRGADLGQQHVDPLARRGHLGVGTKGAGAQGDNLGRRSGVHASETDQRRAAVGDDPELAGDDVRHRRCPRRSARAVPAPAPCASTGRRPAAP